MAVALGRDGFVARREFLVQQRDALIARIDECEQWIAVLDRLEAEQATPELKTATKRTPRK